MRRKTTKEFKKEVHNLVGNEYSVLGKYKNANTKIRMEHNKCNHTYMALPSSFLKGHSRCPYCCNYYHMTTKIFKYRVHKLVGNEYTVLGKYKNIKTKIKMKHNKCGFVYMISPDLFLRGCRCPRCSHINHTKEETKTDKKFKSQVYKLVGNKYTVLGTYKNDRTKIKIRHNKCNNTFYIEPSYLLDSGKCRCPYCYKNSHINTKIFKYRVHKLVGDEYTVLSRYKSSSTKIKIKHNKCGYIFFMKPYSFLEGYRCPRCCYCINFIRKRTKAYKKFKHQMYKLVGNEYTVLGKYKTSDTKIKIKHNKCNNTFYVTPHNFLKGKHKCPYCYKNNKMTTSTFKYRVHKLVGNNYTVLGKYKDSRTKIRIRHNKCHKTFQIKPYEFLESKNKCPFCSKAPRIMTTRVFKYRVYKSVGDNYTVLGKYKKSTTTIKMKHNKCGNIFYVKPINFLNSNCRCPYCSKDYHINTEIFKYRVYRLVGDKYTVLGKYRDSKTKIKMKHNKCGCIFWIQPDNFLNGNGNRCPRCRSSHGELETSILLKSNGFKQYETINSLNRHKNGFIYAYIPNWLQGLHLDFLVKFYDKYIAIEFDGGQHFYPIKFFNGKHGLKCRQKRDLKKDKLCKYNRNIYKLIRIKNKQNYSEIKYIDKLILRTLNKKLAPVIGRKFSLAKKNNLYKKHTNYYIKNASNKFIQGF